MVSALVAGELNAPTLLLVVVVFALVVVILGVGRCWAEPESTQDRSNGGRAQERGQERQEQKLLLHFFSPPFFGVRPSHRPDSESEPPQCPWPHRVQGGQIP